MSRIDLTHDFGAGRERGGDEAGSYLRNFRTNLRGARGLRCFPQGSVSNS
jgi:hypothetical protein